MEKIDYDTVQTLLVDQNHSVRQLIVSALWSVGIRNVIPCKHVGEVDKILGTQQRDIDLVIVNVDGDRDGTLEAVRNIRGARLGSNPFLVIMAHTWNPSVGITQPTLDSGTDDLIVAPLSAQILIDRIGNMVKNRKKFVATMSYMGPERRGSGRPEADELPAIKVPNSLRHKAVNDESASAENGAIERALHTVHTHRVYRVATLLSGETLELEETADRNPDRPISRRKLRQLAVLAAMAKRQIDSKKLVQLSRIGDSMVGVMDTIMDNREPTGRDLEILRLHGQAVAASILERDEAPALLAGALDEAAILVQRQLH